jgi:hypothetical protein
MIQRREMKFPDARPVIAVRTDVITIARYKGFLLSNSVINCKTIVRMIKNMYMIFIF